VPRRPSARPRGHPPRRRPGLLQLPRRLRRRSRPPQLLRRRPQRQACPRRRLSPQGSWHHPSGWGRRHPLRECLQVRRPGSRARRPGRRRAPASGYMWADRCVASCRTPLRAPRPMPGIGGPPRPLEPAPRAAWLRSLAAPDAPTAASLPRIGHHGRPT
jgi:hypothetical protein